MFEEKLNEMRIITGAGMSLERYKAKIKLEQEANEMETIKDFVEKYRAKFNITPTLGRKIELSGEMFGEFNLLLYHQLVLTPYGMNGWKELETDEVREGVLKLIEKEKIKYGIM